MSIVYYEIDTLYLVYITYFTYSNDFDPLLKNTLLLGAVFLILFL